MGVRCCFACLKYLIFTVNFLIFLLGLVLVLVSGGLLTYEQYMKPQDVYGLHCVLLALGAAVFLTSFLGCCGAIRESSCLLGLFFTLTLVFFLGEIVLVVYIYFKEEVVEQAVSFNVQQTVEEKYYNGTLTATLWDVVQTQLECCGGDGPKDWEKSKYNGFQEIREIGIGGNRHAPFFLPPSCCSSWNSTSFCESQVEYDTNFHLETDLYTKGCSQALMVLVKNNIFYILLVCLGILIIEIVGMILSLCLCSALRRIEGHKP